jgi:hypothetical protein
VIADIAALLRRCVPPALKARLSARAKARLRALLGIEPWPDLAVRHSLFRSSEYRRLRAAARAFDVEKPNKPILERGHQASFVLARWFAAAGVGRAFQVGYANGRDIFYLAAVGIQCAGTDLPDEDTAWVNLPEGSLDVATRKRLLRIDFRLTRADVDAVWFEPAARPVSMMFSEATFETLLPWRESGASIPGYLTMDPRERRAMMHERFPAKLDELAETVRNLVFIEPEPSAGETGAVFETCADRLRDRTYSIWRFRPPVRSSVPPVASQSDAADGLRFHARRITARRAAPVRRSVRMKASCSSMRAVSLRS